MNQEKKPQSTVKSIGTIFLLVALFMLVSDFVLTFQTERQIGIEFILVVFGFCFLVLGIMFRHGNLPED